MGGLLSIPKFSSKAMKQFIIILGVILVFFVIMNIFINISDLQIIKDDEFYNNSGGDLTYSDFIEGFVSGQTSGGGAPVAASVAAPVRAPVRAPVAAPAPAQKVSGNSPTTRQVIETI